MDKNMTMLGRRSFLAGMGIAGIGTLAACAPKASDNPSVDELADTGAETVSAASGPKEVTAETVRIIPTGEQMTLEELNEKRQALIDSKTEDYTMADGTVVPNVYVKLRALFDGYGNGLGSVLHDAAFGEVMHLFTPEDAQAYLEMPMGVMFTADQYAEKSGRSAEECAALCEDLSARGLLFRSRSDGEAKYHQLAEAHGIWEYNLNKYEENQGEYVNLHNNAYGADIRFQLFNAQSCFYNAIPCSREVVGDSSIALPYDDWEAIVSKFEKIAVSPCQCRLSHKATNEEDPGDHPLETCLTLGEEAEFYIENGIGREITQQEALEILQRSVEAGLVIQVANSEKTEVICSCHGDCCDILGAYVAMAQNPKKDPSNVNVFEHLSHYELRHNEDTCIKCGSCEKRCPLFAITMNDEGFPEVNGTCVRCGQCGTVCPVGARTLHLRDKILQLPESLLDDYNMKAKYRFDHFMIR